MSSSIKVENLQKEVMKYLTDYTENIEESVKDITDKLSKEAVKEIKQESPRRQGTRKKPYWKGWTRKKEAKGRKYVMKIHNKTNYQLTHLLENRTCNKKWRKDKSTTTYKTCGRKIQQIIRTRNKKSHNKEV